ncbi:MAG: DMT family transporter [Acidimicrobiaceae bacterium]|nr:DMT family transporter [Acidimicrobiaceae bacterium]
MFVLVLAAICWGCTAAASKFALAGFGPMTLLVTELSIAVLIMWLALLIRRWRTGPISMKSQPGYVLLGLLEPGIAYALLTFGLLFTNAANASLLGGFEGVAVVLLAVASRTEKLNQRTTVALALSLVGVILIGGASFSARATWGDLLVLGGVTAAAFYVVLVSRYSADTDSMVLSAWQFTYGLLFALPFVAWRWMTRSEALPIHATHSQWLALIIAGGIGLAASFLLYNSVVTKLPVTITGMTLNLIPVFGLVAAVLVLKETATPIQVLGGMCILIGVSTSSLGRSTARTAKLIERAQLASDDPKILGREASLVHPVPSQSLDAIQRITSATEEPT